MQVVELYVVVGRLWIDALQFRNFAFENFGYFFYPLFSKLTRQLYETARRCQQRVVFAEGTHPNMQKAAVEAKAEGICNPNLLGNEERIAKLAKEIDLNLDGIEI